MEVIAPEGQLVNKIAPHLRFVLMFIALLQLQLYLVVNSPQERTGLDHICLLPWLYKFVFHSDLLFNDSYIVLAHYYSTGGV